MVSYQQDSLKKKEQTFRKISKAGWGSCFFVRWRF